MKRRILLQALALAGCAALFSVSAHAQKVTLNVYTALETDQLKAYQEAFNKQYPDIEIKWTRDSTGVVTAKLLAEKANPVADVVMGLAASSLAIFDKEGMLEPYAPANLGAIAPKFRDQANPPKWVGMDVWGAAICYNVIEAQKRGLPKIESWHDLTRPEFKGQVVMPNPASSGTGFFDVTAWLEMFGEQGGWAYMDKLHDNIAIYTHSGSKPCALAGSGEFAVGISFEYRANTTREKGAPIDVVFPKEGLGWDLEAIGIVKGTPKLDAAKALSDWATSREAMELYAKNFAVVAVPGIATRLKHVPADYEERLVPLDFSKTAANRDAVLTEWQKRYASKSEPKS